MKLHRKMQIIQPNDKYLKISPNENKYMYSQSNKEKNNWKLIGFKFVNYTLFLISILFIFNERKKYYVLIVF